MENENDKAKWLPVLAAKITEYSRIAEEIGMCIGSRTSLDDGAFQWEWKLKALYEKAAKLRSSILNEVYFRLIGLEEEKASWGAKNRIKEIPSEEKKENVTQNNGSIIYVELEIGEYCASIEDAYRLYHLLWSGIVKNSPREVCFRGVKVATSIFFHYSFGQLYEKFPLKRIDQLISITEMQDSERTRLDNILGDVHPELKRKEKNSLLKRRGMLEIWKQLLGAYRRRVKKLTGEKNENQSF